MHPPQQKKQTLKNLPSCPLDNCHVSFPQLLGAFVGCQLLWPWLDLLLPRRVSSSTPLQPFRLQHSAFAIQPSLDSFLVFVFLEPVMSP
jgi:hypothetical protein